MLKQQYVLFLVTFLLQQLLPGEAQGQPSPVGSELVVNTYTTGLHRYPSVAVGPTGDFVVVWSDFRIQGQRFDCEGTRLGIEFQISTSTEVIATTPSVEIQADGGFVVVWKEDYAASAPTWFRRYSATGDPLGKEMLLGSDASGFGDVRPVDVAVQPNGNLWFTLESESGDTIVAKSFDALGAPLGSEFQLNQLAARSGSAPRLAFQSSGEFGVSWSSYGTTGNDSSASIQTRLFNSSGAPTTDQFQVNSVTQGLQVYQDMSRVDEGFVVVWGSYTSLGNLVGGDASVRGQLIDRKGNLIGTEFRVNLATQGRQFFPAVSGNSENFIVVWETVFPDDPTISQGRLYSSDGLPEGNPFRLGKPTSSSQNKPDVGINENGDIVTVWASGSIRAQRYQNNPSASCGSLFNDGFETGDTSRWF